MQEPTNYSSHQLARAFAFEQQGKFQQAQRLCKAFLTKHPKSKEARYLQAKLLFEEKNYLTAETLIQSLLQEDSYLEETSILYAHILLQTDRKQKALDLAYTLQYQTQSINATTCLVHILHAVGNNEAALDFINQAIVINPDDADLRIIQITISFADERYSQTADFCEHFTKQYGLQPLILDFWSISLTHIGKHEQALDILSMLKEISAHDRKLELQWRYQTTLPVIYNSSTELQKYKNHYSAGMTALSTFRYDTKQLKAFWRTKPWGNFYYPYQGTNVLELQKLRAEILTSYVEQTHPELLKPIPKTAKQNGKKIRLGYISASIDEHTIGMFWRSNFHLHDRSKFELNIYYLGQNRDYFLNNYCSRGDKVLCPDANDPFALARRLKEEQLDVLIYPDVGTEPITALLSVMRLAPIQCAQYGHPITTGSTNIDYYLSGELIEPEDAQNHYSETLVKLPNLGLNYQYSLIPQIDSTCRADYGLTEDSFIFASTQSIFKYLPQYDWIYPEILSQTDAKIVFLENKTPELTTCFVNRLKKSFADRNLDFSDRCIVLPRVTPLRRYIGLMKCCNAMLDTPMWSGGRTTFEAISQGLPVVTWPGPYMRASVTAGILKMAKIDQTLASSIEDYIHIAVDLANNSDRYNYMVNQVKRHHKLAFDDKTFVPALESFLEDIHLTQKSKL